MSRARSALVIAAVGALSSCTLLLDLDKIRPDAGGTDGGTVGGTDGGTDGGGAGDGGPRRFHLEFVAVTPGRLDRPADGGLASIVAAPGLQPFTSTDAGTVTTSPPLP